MARRRMKGSSPRVRLRDGDGRTTLSGMRYDQLGRILTMAALHCYDGMKKGEANSDAEVKAYYRESLKVITAIEDALSDGIKATHPAPAPPSYAERWVAVLEGRRFRHIMNKAIEALDGGHKNTPHPEAPEPFDPGEHFKH